MQLKLTRTTSSLGPLVAITVVCAVWLTATFNVFSILGLVFCGFIWLEYFRMKKILSSLIVKREPLKTRLFTNQELVIKHIIISPFEDIDVTVNSQIKMADLLTYTVLERVVTLRRNEPTELFVRTSFATRGKKFLTDFFVVYEHPLSFFKIWAFYMAHQEVLVLPKIMHLESFPARLRELIPGSVSDFRLLEDPTHVRGVREYSNEPLSKVHWKISAKLGSLYVKELDYTAVSNNLIYVDLNLSKEIFAKNVWAQMRTHYEEDAVLVASSVLHLLTKSGNFVDLIVIGKDVLKRDYKPTSDWVNAVELLAMARGDENGPQLVEELENDLERLNPSTTLTVISMYLTDSLVPLLIKARAKCARVMVFLIPYGFRDPRYKPSRSYEMYPLDMQRLFEKARILEKEQIIVRIVRPSQTIQEVFDEIEGS